MISGVVAFFGRPSRGSSSRLIWPRLNLAAYFLIVENEAEQSTYTFMNFEWISFGVKPSFTKKFITARYSVLSILSDTDNTPASDSCIKQTTW